MFDDILKTIDDDGNKVIRAVSLLAASVHVAGMNVALAAHLGSQPYSGDAVLTLTKRFEEHIRSGK